MRHKKRRPGEDAADRRTELHGRSFFTAKGRIVPDVLFLERNSDRIDIILLLAKNYSHRQMMEKFS
jgi:hypothetical protein